MNKLLRTAALAAVLAVMLSGPAAVHAAEVVKTGDNVAVTYTCRLADGSLLLTTEEAVAKDSSIPHSTAYMPMKPAPAEIVAGSGYGGPAWGPLKPLDTAVNEELSRAVVGKTPGESFKVTLKTADSDMRGEENTMTLFRKTDMPLHGRKSLEQFHKQFGRDPVVGEVLQSQPGYPPVKVTGIDGDNVDMRLNFEDGDKVQTVFGPAVLHHKDADTCIQEISPKQGDLVRSGKIIGFISDVTDQKFTVDYINPFGRQELRCEAKVELLPKSKEDSHAK